VVVISFKLWELDFWSMREAGNCLAGGEARAEPLLVVGWKRG